MAKIFHNNESRVLTPLYNGVVIIINFEFNYVNKLGGFFVLNVI